MKQSGYKYLIKNIGVLTIGNFGTKLLTFFLVPLYTAILTTSEFGLFDIINTTVNLLVPILTLNIAEAVLRFGIDEEDSRAQIFTIGLKLILTSMGFLICGVMINHFLGLSKMIDEYVVYFVLLYVVNSISTLLNNFARSIDKVKCVSIAGILGTVSIIGLNIWFLIFMKAGINGYFRANIIGGAVQIVYLFIATKSYKFWINCGVNKKIQHEMMEYSMPLIANTIGWWVNNVSDRYVVTWNCGISINGIYSVAYKIPSILQVFQSIFIQAWTLSAVKDFDAKDENHFFEKTYNLYNFLMIFICSVLIALAQPLAMLLYSKDFYSAWEYVPFLLISVVFGAMSGYIGGIFSAVKNTKIYSQSTIIGACVNVLLNIILVNILGAMGAAIATAISYFLVWGIRMINVKKYMTISLNMKRDFAAYILLVVQSLIVIAATNFMWLLQGLCIVALLVLYINEIMSIKKIIVRKKRKESD